MANPQLFYTRIALGKEASWGAAEGGTTRDIWLPATDPKFLPAAYRHIVDTGLRGQPSQEFDLIAGPGEGSAQWGGGVYLDQFPALLNGIMGQDVKTGAGPTYLHTFSALAVPPSYAAEWVTDVSPYVVCGWYPSQLTINFNGTDGALSYSVQGLGKLGVACAATAWTGPAVPQVAGWQGSIAVAGGNGTLLEGSLTFQRPMRLIHPVSATQNISNQRPGPLQVTGRLTFEYAGTTEWAHYVAAAKVATVLTFQRVVGEVIVITMTAMGWRVATLDVADNIYTMGAQVNGIHNATDAGPCVVTVTNARSTAY